MASLPTGVAVGPPGVGDGSTVEMPLLYCWAFQ